MSIFDRLRRKKDEINEEPQKIDIEKLKKPITPHKPEPKGIDTAIHKKEWQVGEKLLDRYEIKRVLKGGMGVVYIAFDHERHQYFAKYFAIKTFQDKFLWNEDIINRFMEEAETWVNLEKHTNIVFANSVQKIEGKPYIFLEYIDGGDLSQFIGRMDISQALDFAIQFCTGMDYAYNKLGVIHRDIKPGNVMVAMDDRFRFGHAFKVTDFGLVKALGKEYMEGLLESLSISTGMGTWPYMPPEQFPESIQSTFYFTPTPITTRTDIYSFGVTFYEVLTGKLPFADVSEIFTNRPINPMRINSQVPERVDRLIMKCLEKKPMDRYQNFEEQRKDLITIYNDLTREKYVIKGKKEELTYVEWSNKGFALENLGRHEEALNCYDKSLEIKPTYGVWSNKGLVLHELERYEEAIECHNEALKRNSKSVVAWTNKGFALEVLRRDEEAMECYDMALDINREYVEAWYNKGSLLGNLGRYKEAVECHSKALEIYPRHVKAWNEKGVALNNLRRHEEALACFDKALKMDPKIAVARNNKGFALLNLKRHEEALACFDKALEIDPKIAEARNNKGLALLNLGRHEEALECFDKALEIDPKIAKARNNKGTALLNLGRHEEALECFDKALEINPRLAEAYYGKGAVPLSLRRDEEALEKALECFDKALEINPRLAEAYYSKGAALLSLRRYEEALECFEEFLKIAPQNVPEVEQAKEVITRLRGII